MKKLFKKWGANTQGATAIEYSLIAAGISLALALTVYTFGGELSTFFSTFFDAFE